MIRNGKKGTLVFIVMLCAALFLAACSGNNGGSQTGGKNEGAGSGTGSNGASQGNGNAGNNETEPPQGNESRDPITVKILWHDPTTFERWFVDEGSPVRQQFPHITFELLQTEGYYQNQLDQVLSTGEKPDMVWGNIYTISLTEQAGVFVDLKPYIEQFQLDMSRYPQGVVDEIGAYSPTVGTQYLIPWNRSYAALAYNKDIFDKFNVAYPTDDMNWDQIYELAKQLTREDGGVRYRGFEFGDPETPIKQIPNFIIDTQRDKADISWIRPVLENMDRFWSVPGMLAESEEPLNHSTANQGWARFMNDRNLAMVAGNIGVEGLAEAELKDGLHWDMVTFPTFPDRPGEAPGAYIDGWGVSVTSAHKDEVFEVIEFITRPEVNEQYNQARIEAPVLELMGTKNMAALTKHNPSARITNMSLLEENSKGAFWEGLNVLAAREKDVNSTLQLMQEIAEQRYEDAKAQQ